MMVPRPEVVALSIDLPPEECLARGDRLAVHPLPGLPRVARRHRRHPPRARPLLRDARAGHRAGRDRGRRPARPHRPGDEGPRRAAAEFRRQNQHMAIVVDEYGAMEGIVTLEDLLEEIVGEIEDEFDLPGRVGRAHRRDARSASTARSRSTTSTSSSAASSPLEDYHTMAGFVFGLLGRAPEPGDEVDYDGLRFRVDRGRGLPHRAAGGRVRPAAGRRGRGETRGRGLGQGRSLEVSTTSKSEPVHAAERVQVVVRPARVGRAADVPVRAVVGDDHPVALERRRARSRACRGKPRDRVSTPSGARAGPSAAGRHR